MPRSSSKPTFTEDTVLLIGNGIMRVPCKIDENPNASPSWVEYMEQLWQLVSATNKEAVDSMSQNDFEKLSAPRQAQWFDENFSPPGLKPEKHDAVLLRLHMLAEQLHPTTGFLTNKLLDVVGKLVAKSAEIQSSKPEDGSRESCVHVLTTNLDSALEQNFAHAIDEWCINNQRDIAAEIEVMAGFRQSAVWRRKDAEKPKFRIRLWKLHGCLRDLRSNTNADDRNRLMTIYRTLPGKSELVEFCAAVPDEELTPSLAKRWKLVGGRKAEEGEVTTIFSQTEYFNNLKFVAQMSHRSADEGTFGSQLTHFRALSQILEDRPLLITGYSLTEGDVDIVFLLQTICGPSAKRHAMLEQAIEATADQIARLKLMGIDTWTYEVPSVGFIPTPGRLKHTAQFEWRREPYDQPWRNSLQTLSARSWLIPQFEHLTGLYNELSKSTLTTDDPPATIVRTKRLAVAGLGSIWHAFSLRETNDFPNRRRVSSALNSVDAQVPGGSGLVPIMQAAAMAGPMSAGSMAFFSNVPERWKSWPEIKEFCLSGGVDVYPFQTLDTMKMDRQTGRNSYVLLFDHECHDDITLQPRQRFIMDVNSVVKESLANKPSTSVAGESGTPDEQNKPPEQPKACLPLKFKPTHHDLLFADKETDAEALKAWLGPKIFETGASGDELATNAFNTLQPQIWTSGVGSLLRTAVRIEKCFSVDPPGIDTFPKEITGVLKLLDAKPKIKQLIACATPKTGETGIDMEASERIRRRYAAKLVSFKKIPWNEGNRRLEAHGQEDGVPAGSTQSKYEFEEGFRYQDEVDYGQWLLGNWWWAGTLFLDIVLDTENKRNVLLGCPDKRLGRGILTTIHEGGLMAAWEFAEGRRQLIRVIITKTPAELLRALQVQTVVNKFEFTCETRNVAKDGTSLDEESLKAVIEIETRQTGVDKTQSPLLEHKLTLRCSGSMLDLEFVERLGPKNRWNTLAAGDTVRGALAFGLWAYAYEENPAAVIPRDIPHILFASTILATIKCYAGSFVDFLQLLQKLRTHSIWPTLWGSTSVASTETFGHGLDQLLRQ